MKRLWLLLTAAVMLASCTSEKPASDETVPDPVQEETAAVDTDIRLTE